MYEDMIRETEEMIRGVMLREQIAEWVLYGMCLVMLVMVIVAWRAQRKARKAERMTKVVGGFRYEPTVSNDVQVVNGVEFHRMGVPYRE